MTTTFQQFDTIGAGTRFTFAGAGDSYFVLPDAIVGNSNEASPTIVSTFADVSLEIDGYVYGADRAVNLAGGSSSMRVGSDGVVASTNSVFADVAVWLQQGDNALNNAGQISGERTIAILTSGGDNLVVNTGSITGSSGVFVGLNSSSGDQLVNSGFISANNLGSTTIRYSHAVHTEGADTMITNLAGGQILSTSESGAGVHIGDGNAGSGDGSVVTNYGEITSTQNYGVDFLDMENSEVATLTNYGVISGGAGSFIGNESGETVTNGGVMNGNVLLRQGDDTYQGRGDGVVAGEVRGAAGDDTLFGASGEDLFDGGTGADDLRGRGGDDILQGDDGDDLIAGNTGNDRVDGNQGDDTLFGNRGDDTIRGGSGNDTITGGRGDDVLTGNSGSDVFVFNRRTDDDIIVDFRNNVDQLDLTALDIVSVGAFRSAGGIIENGSGSIIDLTVAGGDGVIYVSDMAFADWTGVDFII